MSKLYTERTHTAAIEKLKEEYEGRLRELQAAMSELKEENRRLSAEIKEFESKKQAIGDALLAASEKREEMQRELQEYVRSQKNLAAQATEKAQMILEEVRKAYPNQASFEKFSAFEKRLQNVFSDVENADDTEAEKEDWKLDEVLRLLGI